MTTIDLQSKTVYIPFGEFFANLFAGLIVIFLAVVGILLGMFAFGQEEVGEFLGLLGLLGFGGAGLCCLGLIFQPILVGRDVSGRVPEIAELKEKHEELKDLEIRHPYFWAIVLMNLLTFWSIVGWFVAMIWACSPGRVVIPDKFLSKLGSTGDSSSSPKPTTAHDQGTDGGGGLKEALQEIESLKSQGLISDEEAEARRKLILNR